MYCIYYNSKICYSGLCHHHLTQIDYHHEKKKFKINGGLCSWQKISVSMCVSGMMTSVTLEFQISAIIHYCAYLVCFIRNCSQTPARCWNCFIMQLTLESVWNLPTLPTWPNVIRGFVQTREHAVFLSKIKIWLKIIKYLYVSISLILQQYSEVWNILTVLTYGNIFLCNSVENDTRTIKADNKKMNIYTMISIGIKLTYWSVIFLAYCPALSKC